MAVSPQVLNAVQTSRALQVVDQSAETELMATRLGIDLSHFTVAFQSMPLGVEGGEHSERRKRLSRAIAGRPCDCLDALRDQALQRCHACFSKSGRVELMSELFSPVIRDLIEGISGASLPHNVDHMSAVQVFDRHLGPSRRKKLNLQIKQMHQEILAQSADGAIEHDPDTVLALAILGYDTILGALAVSFAERVQANPGKRLNEIEWGSTFTRTSVPFVERQAVEDVEISGQLIRKGETVRLYLDRYSYEDPHTRTGFFGSGRHACTGRPVSLKVWKIMSDLFAKQSALVSVEEIPYREADCMFLFPNELWVSIDV